MHMQCQAYGVNAISTNISNGTMILSQVQSNHLTNMSRLKSKAVLIDKIALKSKMSLFFSELVQ